MFTPDRNPPAEFKGAKARRSAASTQLTSSLALALAHTRADTQVVGLAGVPLPFYKSDTLLLSFGLSWRVYAMVRRALLPRGWGAPQWLTRPRPRSCASGSLM